METFHSMPQRLRSVFCSLKYCFNHHQVYIAGPCLQNINYFKLIGLLDLISKTTPDWITYFFLCLISCHEVGIFFTISKILLTLSSYYLYISQVSPSLEYCSQIWGEVSPLPLRTLNIFDIIQRINDISLSLKNFRSFATDCFCDMRFSCVFLFLFSPLICEKIPVAINILHHILWILLPDIFYMLFPNFQFSLLSFRS